MLQLKQYIKIVSLFMLLFVVISVPAYFMDHQNNQAFNKTSVYSVDAVQLGDNDVFQSNNSPSQSISVWERINPEVQIATAITTGALLKLKLKCHTNRDLYQGLYIPLILRPLRSC